MSLNYQKTTVKNNRYDSVSPGLELVGACYVAVREIGTNGRPGKGSRPEGGRKGRELLQPQPVLQTACVTALVHPGSIPGGLNFPGG